MIPARIQGIPCLIEVIDPGWYSPAVIHLAPEDCYPADGEPPQFRVYDRRGRLAPWLERKMTDRDVENIEQMIAEEA